MVLDNLIPIKLGALNIKYYRELGYQGKYGEQILVRSVHLQDGCAEKEERICDCCGKKYIRRHSQHIKSYEIWGKDVCNKCFHDKEFKKIIQEKRENTLFEKYGAKNPSNIVQFQENRTQTMVKKYGVENYFQSESFNKKRKETNLQKYRVEFASQNERVQQKIKEACLEKYGVENPTLDEKIRKKQINTCLEKYGAISSLGNKEIREKGKQTMLQKYGCDNARKSSLLQEKAAKTKTLNGSTPTSQQQIKVKELLENMYSQDKVRLNYVVSSLSLDVALFLEKDIKIDIEYDGNYWHKDLQKDRRRDEFIKSQGFKILRIRSGRLVPTTEQMEEAINELKERKNFVGIVLPDWNNNN